MYWPKQRAREPESIGLFATEHDGIGAFFRPALAASARMAAGVMSAVPVIFCCLSESLTVDWPFTPMTIATTPKTIRTRPAIRPPISNNLRISISFDEDFLLAVDRSDSRDSAPSGFAHDRFCGR